MELKLYIGSLIERGPGDKRKLIQQIVSEWLRMHRTANELEMTLMLKEFISLSNLNLEEVPQDKIRLDTRFNPDLLEFVIVREMIRSENVQADLTKMIEEVRSARIGYSHFQV